MLLGKRPRPPIIRRTKSMSGGMSVDNIDSTDHQPNSLEPHHEEQSVMESVSHHNPLHPHPIHDEINDPHALVMGTETHDELTVSDERLVGPSHTITNNSNHNPLSAREHVIHSIPHFLQTCGLCNSRLTPARDIYMYRGDVAFCSLECREHQIKEDKRKEKWKVGISNNEDHRISPPPCTATAKTSTAACT